MWADLERLVAIYPDGALLNELNRKIEFRKSLSVLEHSVHPWDLTS